MSRPPLVFWLTLLFVRSIFYKSSPLLRSNDIFGEWFDVNVA